MEIKEINLSDLKPYEHNNKVHDEEQIEMIANSIKEFWFTQPIVIDEDNCILAWHWRYYASQKLWLEKVPCNILEWLTEQQKRRAFDFIYKLCYIFTMEDGNDLFK